MNPITYHIQDVYSGVRGVAGNFAIGNKLVIYPGSFNPLHEGHKAIFKLAKKILDIEPIFEICIKNFDKGTIDAKEMERRLGQFKDYPYMLSRGQYFRDKVKILRDELPDNPIIFLLGNDTWERIETKDYDFFLRNNVRFLVFPRYGKRPEFAKYPKLLVYVDDDYLHDFNSIPKISSTQIRNQTL